MEEDIKILEEWVEVDRRTRNNSMESDFDKFCEEKNVAIENLINRVKDLDEENKELNKDIGKEYQLGYGQGEYEVNECWKSKIREKIDYYIGMYEIGKLHEDEASKYQMQAILSVIEDLQELLEDK